jgi:hypothetical protein
LAGSAGLRADGTSSVLLTLSADRNAVCTGGIHNDVHQAHLVATVTDLGGQPLAGELVTFSADHQFVKIGPSFDPPVAITDADGEARTVLTSGDEIEKGKITARCEGAEGTVPMSFETPELEDFICTDADTGARLTSYESHGHKPLALAGVSRVRVEEHETWRGEPVPGHAITWELFGWLLTNQRPWDEDTADYKGGLGQEPFGSLSPGSGATDEQGATVTFFTVGTARCPVEWQATDDSVWHP